MQHWHIYRKWVRLVSPALAGKGNWCLSQSVNYLRT
jgi:hypothetical protein